jgi:alkylation response protein AidB-like acyl-CoA dehydrogenase
MKIPAENLLGGPGNGYRILLESVAIGKLSWSAQGVGMAQAALDESMAYAKERMVQGKPIVELLNIQWLLSEIAVKVEACRLMTYKAAWHKDQGESIVAPVAMSKYFSSVYSVEAISQALQVHGSYGYTKDFKVERLYRDSKLNHVIEGSLETQRLIIANYVIRQYG